MAARREIMVVCIKMRTWVGNDVLAKDGRSRALMKSKKDIDAVKL